MLNENFSVIFKHRGLVRGLLKIAKNIVKILLESRKKHRQYAGVFFDFANIFYPKKSFISSVDYACKVSSSKIQNAQIKGFRADKQTDTQIILVIYIYFCMIIRLFSLGVHDAFCYFHLLLGLPVHLYGNLMNTNIALMELKRKIIKSRIIIGNDNVKSFKI